MLVVNFDEAIQKHKASTGLIIQKHEGLMLCTGGKSLSHCNIPYVELIGA